MKRIFLALLAALGLSLGASPAMAQSQTADVNVSAVVPQVCRFVTASANLLIEHAGGVIDPLSTADATGATTLDFFCGVGVQVQFATAQDPTNWAPGVGGVTDLTRVGGTETLSASVTINNMGDAPIGQGYATSLPVNVNGTISATSYSTVPAGTYTGVQTFNIRGQPQ